MVLSVVARVATPAEFEQLHAIAKGARNETELRRYYRAMLLVRDPALAKQASEIAMSDEIPAQAADLRLPLLAALGDAHPALAWDIFTKNVDGLMRTMPTSRRSFLRIGVAGAIALAAGAPYRQAHPPAAPFLCTAWRRRARRCMT